MTAETFLQRPRLRAGVAIDENLQGFTVRLRGSSCQIDSNEAARAPLRQLLSTLAQGVDPAEVCTAFGDFSENARAVIDQLDRFGYITEGAAFEVRTDLVEADTFLRALYRLAEGDHGDATPSPSAAQGVGDGVRGEGFTWQLAQGTAQRAQLVRYAIEYLHIVRHGPGLVAPLLNWVAEPALRAEVSEFLHEEWRHDRLLAQSLDAVGLNADAVRPAAMLPPTFALLAQLGVRATTDPLALASLLYIYERSNPAFHALYADNCRRVGLPEAFLGPVLRHASMNDAGRHDDIAALLVRHFCPVGRERAVAALSDASVAMEHLRRLDLALGQIPSE
jgi:Iron-containing redox enzyme